MYTLFSYICDMKINKTTIICVGWFSCSNIAKIHGYSDANERCDNVN